MLDGKRRKPHDLTGSATDYPWVQESANPLNHTMSGSRRRHRSHSHSSSNLKNYFLIAGVVAVTGAAAYYVYGAFVNKGQGSASIEAQGRDNIVEEYQKMEKEEAIKKQFDPR
ncbi:MAG: hypothetical protein R3F11_23440 [Verrucomicrobiales bacterium]